MAAIGSSLYAILRFGTAIELWRFETDRRSWSRLASPPRGAAMRAAAVGVTLFSCSENTFAAYDPATNAWRPVPSPPEAFRYTPAIAPLSYTRHGQQHEQLVAFSGPDSGLLQAWEPAAQSWIRLPPPPGWGTAGGTIAVVGSKIFAFRTGTGGVDIAVFDATAQTWSTLAYPGWMLVPPIQTDTVAAAGEWVFAPNPSSATAQYDTRQDQWYFQAGEPGGANPISAAVCGSSLYLLAGPSPVCFTSFGLPSGAWARRLQNRLGKRPVGWSVAVMRDGAVIDVAGWGVSSFGRDQVTVAVPFVPDTPLNYASVSKPITGTAVMREFQASKRWRSLPELLRSKFYAVISSVIPNPGKGPDADPQAGVDTVTVGQLLRMRSGMANFPEPWEQYLPYMTRFVQHQMTRVPGTAYEYVNANFGIFQLILAAWNGDTSDPARFYQRYVQEHVFGPMGISGIGIGPFATEAYANGQTSGSGHRFPLITSSTSSGGWGGTVLDLVRFLAGLRTDAVLSQANVEAMLTNELGWYPIPVTGGTAYWHGGALRSVDGQGLMTMAIRFPDGTDAAWLCNTWGLLQWYEALPNIYNALHGAPEMAVPDLGAMVMVTE